MNRALFLIRIILMCCCLCASTLICSNSYRTWKTVNTANTLVSIYESNTDSEFWDWSHGLLDINPDYVGWLTIPGTTVDGPVVQGNDNTEYLRTDFFGEPASSGTLFIDENADMNTSGNFIVYGHLMRDGTMFADLAQYKSKELFETNSLVRWETRTGIRYYKLFAGLIVSGSDSPIRAWLNKQTPEQEKEMLNTIAHSAYFYQEDLLRSGPYLFLITCDYQKENGRLVLVASAL